MQLRSKNGLPLGALEGLALGYQQVGCNELAACGVAMVEMLQGNTAI